jgi:hypothetical protein
MFGGVRPRLKTKQWEFNISIRCSGALLEQSFLIILEQEQDMQFFYSCRLYFIINFPFYGVMAKIMSCLFFCFLGGFLWDWGMNAGLHTFKVGTVPLELYLQSILLWLVWRCDLLNYFPQLALNHKPPNQLGLQA